MIHSQGTMRTTDLQNVEKLRDKCLSGPYNNSNLWYLDDADRFPGQVEAGVEQEGDGKRQSSVPAEWTTFSQYSRAEADFKKITRELSVGFRQKKLIFG